MGFLSGPKKILDLLGKAEKRNKTAQGIVAATGLSLATVLGAMSLYDSFFPRYERPDYSTYFGIYNYERAKKYVEREEFYYPVGDVKLKGYYYAAKRPKGLVMVCHGLHAGGDDYLPIIIYLVKNHFSVFAYDGEGTYDSEGSSTVGMCQALVDADRTIGFIQSSTKYGKLPLLLLGHSCGGYAVTSVLALRQNIRACAAIAPVNNCYTLILEKGRQYAGGMADAGLPKVFLEAYQKVLFGKYADCSGTQGINSTTIPVLIAHGTDDKIISYSGQSIIAHKEEITNPNVEYYVESGVQGGHDSIWHSKRSAEYKEEINAKLAEIKKIKDDKERETAMKELTESVDNDLYSEVNEELMSNIVRMYNDALKIKEKK